MVTPFDDEGGVDLDGAAELARWLVEQGNDALVLTGTTGEASCLTDSEQVAVWRTVRDAVDVPVLAGSGTNDTRHAAELTSRAKGAGMDAVLVVTPYYNRPSQAGIEAHFRHVAAATELPVLMYDIPVRTGRKISSDLLLRLAHEVPNIVGLKDAAGNPGETARIVSRAPEGFVVYSGDDSLTLPLLAVGAVGVIGVATHWAAPVMAEMISSFRKGDLARARELNGRLIESYDFESGDLHPNPVPTKAMLNGPWQAGGAVSPADGVSTRWTTGTGARRAPTVVFVTKKSRKEQGSGLQARRARPGQGQGRTGPVDADAVKVTFLGGLGEIGRNCACIEVDGRSSSSTAGSCSPISTCSASTWCCRTSPTCARTPTASSGCIATHGHEDHVGGLSYLLRELSFPIYGTALTLGLARNRIEEAGLLDRTEFIPVTDGERRMIGPSTWSSSPSPTRCRTAWPPPSTPPRA